MYTVGDFLERRVAVQCANVEEKNYLRSLIPDGWTTTAFDYDDLCFVCRPNPNRVLYFSETSISYEEGRPTYGVLDVVSPYDLHQDGFAADFDRELFSRMLMAT